jgi:hypothetical protein
MATTTPLHDLADQAVAMAETLRELLPADVGFVLVLTGIPTGGSMIHVSSKVDAVEVLERSLARALQRRDTPPAAGN